MFTFKIDYYSVVILQVFSDFPSYKVFPDPSAVVIKKELGGGGFGTVFKATLKQSVSLYCCPLLE